MNKLMYGRVKLLRALKSAKGHDLFNTDEQAIIDKIFTDIRKDKKQHFLSIPANDINSVTYAQKPEFKLDEQRRQRTSIRKYIRSNLRIDAGALRDATLDSLGKFIAKRIISNEWFENNIKIIQGRDIVEVYKQGEAHSCMTGGSAFKCNVYALNPEKIKMVLLAPNTRALLWKCDDGSIVLDRIYPAGNDNVEILLEWAARNKYLVRKAPDQLAERPALVGDHKKYVSINCDGVFPYLDTMCFCQYTKGENKAVVSNDEEFGNIFLRHTDGSFALLPCCCECSRRVTPYNNYAHGGKQYCMSCFEKHFFRCYMCSSVHRLEDKKEIGGKTICKSCLEANFIHCEYCSTFIKRAGAKFVRTKESGNKQIGICEDCYAERYFVCTTCERGFLNIHGRIVTQKSYCPSCFSSMLFGYGDNC